LSKSIAWLLSVLLIFGNSRVMPAELPDIGSPASAVISQSEEYRIGRMIVRNLRDEGVILEDPEVTEYLQSIGSRIAAQTPQGGQQFQFFAVREGTINAFALPGGFIGVNYGLILATKNESELASVLAHEIAHVTQRHIARTVKAQSKQSITAVAAILAAVLVGAVSGGSGDVAQGAIALAQGAAAQQQINFTRANEYEADRVGIGFLAAAGFDPFAMPSFFETMSRRSGLAATYVPEMIQSHPVTSNRIAESRNRAQQATSDSVSESGSYALIRERLRVITASNDANLVDYYDKLPADEQNQLGRQYGRALALLAKREPQLAAQILTTLVEQHPNLILLYVALSQAQLAAGLTNDGLVSFSQNLKLFPRNVPLSVRYAEALMSNQQPKEAHRILLDVFNNVAPTPEQIRLTALAASSAGDTGDAYHYMSEYHIASGDLPLAVQQLELALAAPNLTSVQRQRFRARLEEIREALAASRDKRTATK
jgi:beta-barrel assembly-enhancing protease